MARKTVGFWQTEGRGGGATEGKWKERKDTFAENDKGFFFFIFIRAMEPPLEREGEGRGPREPGGQGRNCLAWMTDCPAQQKYSGKRGAGPCECGPSMSSINHLTSAMPCHGINRMSPLGDLGR